MKKLLACLTFAAVMVSAPVTQVDHPTKVRQTMASVVRIDVPQYPAGKGGTRGSGVITKMWSEAKDKKFAYVLTASHVVKAVPRDAKGAVLGKQPEVHLLYNPITGDSKMSEYKKYSVSFVYLHPRIDIAIIKINLGSDDVRPIGRYYPGEVKPMFRVFSLGCPLGAGLYYSDGYLSYLMDDEGAQSVFGVPWLCNSEVDEGSSGGGVFHYNTGALLGVTVALYAYSDRWGFIKNRPNLHIFIPFLSFRDWMEEHQYI